MGYMDSLLKQSAAPPAEVDNLAGRLARKAGAQVATSEAALTLSCQESRIRFLRSTRKAWEQRPATLTGCPRQPNQNR